MIITLTGCMFWADQPNVGSEDTQIGASSSQRSPNPDNFQYYNTLEEAVTHNTLSESNITYIGKKIKLLENSQYAVLFFKSNVHGKDVLYIFKFFVKEIDGTCYYSTPISSLNIAWETRKLSVQQMKLDAIGEIRLCIALDNYSQRFRIDNTKNFFWGISQTPQAKNLKIEGQPATEVIPVKMDGDTAYFWYFADLKTDKKPVFQSLTKYVKGDFVITVDK